MTSKIKASPIAKRLTIGFMFRWRHSESTLKSIAAQQINKGAPAVPVFSNKIFLRTSEAGNATTSLPPHFFNNCTKQVNYVLGNNSDLFNFISRPPMFSIPVFYQGKTLGAFV